MIYPCPEDDKQATLEYLQQRFGLPRSLFAEFEFYAGPNGRVILGPKQMYDHLEPDTAGLLIARIGRTVKPSTNLLQLSGRHVSRNFVTLNREQTTCYIRGDDLELTDEGIGGTAEGYVLLKYQSFPLGCGLLQGRHIKNMLPRAKRLHLQYL